MFFLFFYLLSLVYFCSSFGIDYYSIKVPIWVRLSEYIFVQSFFSDLLGVYYNFSCFFSFSFSFSVFFLEPLLSSSLFYSFLCFESFLYFSLIDYGSSSVILFSSLFLLVFFSLSTEMYSSVTFTTIFSSSYWSFLDSCYLFFLFPRRFYSYS